MRGFIRGFALLAVCLSLSLVACGGEDDVSSTASALEEAAAVDSIAALEAAAAAAGPECRIACSPCEFGQPCNQVCHLQGQCHGAVGTCLFVEDCVDGFSWNDNACKCLPDRP